jgi:HPt (histidine-containing phosphotransfer) domain-containing protein
MNLMGLNTVEVESDLADLIPNFLNKRLSEIKIISQSIEVKNFVELKKIGHDVRGIAGAFGYHFIVNLGFEIEKAAQDQDIEKLNSLIVEYKFGLEHHLIRIEGDSQLYHPEGFLKSLDSFD